MSFIELSIRDMGTYCTVHNHNGTLMHTLINQSSKGCDGKVAYGHCIKK